MTSLKSEKDAFFEKLQFYTQHYYQGFGLECPVTPAAQMLLSGTLRAEVPLLHGF